MQDSHSFFSVLQQYFAGSAMVPVFVMALAWIILKWKKEYRGIVVAILCGSVLLFNELIYRVFEVVGEGITYYRLLWVIPLVLVIAVFAVENISRLKRNRQVVVVSIALLAIFMFSSQTGAEWVSLPENIYQVDKDVIQVADTVMELTNGERVYLLDNGELDMSIRQYEPRIVYTNNLESGLWEVMKGASANVLGSDIILATHNDRSKYLALRKDELLAHKLMESAGHTLVADTDNYQIYQVDYDQVYWDWEKATQLAEGVVNRISIEYIQTSGAGERCGYVYITDFGSIENDTIYQELLGKIASFQPQGIIINDSLSENSEWYLQCIDSLEALQIPYYCNNREFQVIEGNEFIICMLDNTDGISDTVLAEFQALANQNKPVVVVLSTKVENEADKFYSLLAEQDFVVQVLSARKGDYTKDLLGENLLQYAVPVDENQILSMIYIEGSESIE